MGGPVRLDLGCGDKREKGWVRVDYAVAREAPSESTDYGDGAEIAYETAPDVACDLRALPLPDDYADEARAIHVIEHFLPWESQGVVAEWTRVLKPGGELAIECPCLDKIIALFQVPQVHPSMTMWGLYGDPRYKDPLMLHRWCYTQAQLLKLMELAGLVNIRSEPPRFHAPIRDMRLVGQKPVGERRIVLNDE